MSAQTLEKSSEASEVKHGAPLFIKKVLKQQYPDREISSNYDVYTRTLKEFLEGIGLDHWGSTIWNNIDCFVTEPYGMSEERVLRVKEKCRQLGLAVVYSPVAFHNSGCRRLLIFPTDMSLIETYPREVIEALTEAGCRMNGSRLEAKAWNLRRSPEAEKTEFEKAINESGRVSYDFFHTPIAVSGKGNAFELHCLASKEKQVARTLSATKKRAKQLGTAMPEVTIHAINDDELIDAGYGFYAGNSGDFVGAFVQKYVPGRNRERLEGAYKMVLGSLLKSIRVGQPDSYGEQHVLFELQTPISFIAFRDAIDRVKSVVGKQYGIFPRLGKGREWKDGFSDLLSQVAD